MQLVEHDGRTRSASHRPQPARSRAIRQTELDKGRLIHDAGRAAYRASRVERRRVAQTGVRLERHDLRPPTAQLGDAGGLPCPPRRPLEQPLFARARLQLELEAKAELVAVDLAHHGAVVLVLEVDVLLHLVVHHAVRYDLPNSALSWRLMLFPVSDLPIDLGRNKRCMGLPHCCQVRRAARC